jgi:hypothetical protein
METIVVSAILLSDFSSFPTHLRPFLADSVKCFEKHLPVATTGMSVSHQDVSYDDDVLFFF